MSIHRAMLPKPSDADEEDPDLWQQIADQVQQIECAYWQRSSQANRDSPPLEADATIGRPRVRPGLSHGSPLRHARPPVPVYREAQPTRGHASTNATVDHASSVRVHARTTPAVAETGAGKALSCADGDNGQASTTLPLADDSFSRLLREKEEELEKVRLAKDGEIANLRHRMRALSSELDARASAAASGPSPIAHERLEVALRDRAVFEKEARIANAEAKKFAEQLAFARQELAESKKRERIVAGTNVEKTPTRRRTWDLNERVGAAQPRAHGDAGFEERHRTSSNPGGSVYYPSQGGSEFVESTQAGGALVTPDGPSPAFELRRGPRRPVRRRRSAHGIDLTQPSQGSGADAEHGRALTQQLDVSRDSKVNGSRASAEGNAGYDVGRKQREERGTIAATTNAEDMEDVCANGQGKKRGRPRGSNVDVQVLRVPVFDDKVVMTARLRHQVLGAGRAQRLLELCTRLHVEGLRRSLAAVMAGDKAWDSLLVPLAQAALCDDVELSIAALGSMCNVVEHDARSRRLAVLDAGYREVSETALELLESATERVDTGVAWVCLRVVSSLAAEAHVLASEECATTNNRASEEEEESQEACAVRVRRSLEHEAILIWLQLHDADKAECCAVATGICADLIVNVLGVGDNGQDEREGDFIEQSILCFAGLLSSPLVSMSIKSSAMCAMEWMSSVAPYFADEEDGRVLEHLCVLVADITYRVRLGARYRRRAMQSFCEPMLTCLDSAPACWRAADETRLRATAAREMSVLEKAVLAARRIAVRGNALPSATHRVSEGTLSVVLGALALVAGVDTRNEDGHRVGEVGEGGEAVVFDGLACDSALARNARDLADALRQSRTQARSPDARVV